MGHALPIRRPDASSVCRTKRSQAEDAAAMALWARCAGGGEGKAEVPRPWESFSENRSNGCRHSQEAAAHAERNFSGIHIAIGRSGASRMGGRGHLAERRDGMFQR